MPTSCFTRINSAGVVGYDAAGVQFGVFHGQIKDVVPTPMGCAIVLEDGTKIRMMAGYNRIATTLLDARKAAEGIK